MPRFKKGDVVMATCVNKYGVTDSLSLFVAIVMEDTAESDYSPLLERTLFTTYDKSSYYSLFSSYKNGLIGMDYILHLMGFPISFTAPSQGFELVGPFRVPASNYVLFDRKQFLSMVMPHHQDLYRNHIDDFVAMMDTIYLPMSVQKLPTLKL